MAKATIRRHLPHSAQDMMHMVANVERYPEFVGLVSGLRLLTPKVETANGYHFEAEMMIRYKMISETFRCRVEVDNIAQTVKVSKADKTGAIKSLVNDWKFRTLSDGSTLLDFYIDVTLKSMPLNFLVNQKFDFASEKVMSWFINFATLNYPKVGKGKAGLVAEIEGIATPIRRA